MESILSPMMFFNIKVGNNRERTKQKSTFLYIMHKFLFEAPNKHLSPRSVANGKSKRGFSYGTLFASLKAKEIRLRNKNKKHNSYAER